MLSTHGRRLVKCTLPWLLASFLTVHTSNAANSHPDPKTADLDLEELTETRVEVAAGHPQPISRAPAVASVITSEEILAMGATNLAEVLETVAGLHVVWSGARNLDSVFSIRGVRTPSSALILVNGVASLNLVLGGSIVGRHAAELISIISLCVTNQLTVSDLSETLFVHPTLSETLSDAAE